MRALKEMTIEPSPQGAVPSAELIDAIVHQLAQTMVSRDALERILETMLNAIVVIDGQSMIQSVNQSACDLLGRERSELMGHPFSLIADEETLWGKSCWEEVRRQGSVRNLEINWRGREGEAIAVLFSASLICDREGVGEGVVCAAQDIREHLRLRHALRSSQESFQAIVDKSADGIFIVDQDGVSRFVNPAAELLLNRRRDELLGIPFGFPVVNGNITEVDVVRRNGEFGVAEMRSVWTEWEERPALLVSLRDVTETVRLREELRLLTLVDELTGLHNRRGFLLLAQQARQVMERSNLPMTLMFIDMDGMKAINDGLGHQYGDQALLELSAILKSVFRKSDILARIGGDEFLVLSCEHGSDGGILRRRLLQEIDRHNNAPHRPFQLSVSLGAVSASPLEPLDLEKLIAAADQAMYEVKRKKKSEATLR
ncbi:MAG: diguanylate cyclase [Magnetococcales bacterium]|nr:diguanylate cyclase [Magnetococcales bacterium]